MASPESSIRIYMLGRFEVACGERVLRSSEWTRRKAAALLQRLALERRLVKDQAIDFLWPEADITSGANNFYRTLHALRQTLDAALGAGTAEATVQFADGVLVLDDAVWVDVAEFESLAQSEDQPVLAAALALYTGDLLPDERYAEWALVPRDALRSRQRDIRLTLAALARDAHEYSSGLELLTPLLSQDPADEPVHRELMRLYALSGRRHEALRQHQACVNALAAELDVSPEPETAALYSQILAGEVAASPAPVPQPRRFHPPVHLPADDAIPFAGRESEVETLRNWLEVARKGQGQTVLLAGDSGVGKTRLALECLQAATSAGMTTLIGAAYEQEGQLPYQPFVEAFDRYLSEHLDTPITNPITHFKRQGSDDVQQEHRALFNATAAFLTGLAAHRPVLLILDDLHAADETSLRLFHFLARQTQAAPVILLATYRSDEPATPASPFGVLLNSFYRERLSETLNLSPLDLDAVAGIVEHILGDRVYPTLVTSVFKITEGNPFFAQEITRELKKSGQVEKHRGQWRLRARTQLGVPTQLGVLVRERVTRLGESVEPALTAAAVAGREFSFDVLRGAVSLSDEELLDALDAALVGHLLEETEGGYRFVHPLIRRTLYDSLSRTRRARLHGGIAGAIEAMYAQRPNEIDTHVEELAFHFDLSDRRDRALDYLIRSGRKAARMYAFEVAVNYYERALALLDALTPEPDPQQQFRLLESLGKYYKILADTPKAIAAFERALEVSGESWRPQSGDLARIHRLAAMNLLTAGQLKEATSHLQSALAELNGSSNTLELASVLYNIAQLHWHRNEYQEAFEVAQNSLAVAERLNDRAAIARAFEILALACHSLGEWQAGIGFEERRAALAGPSLDVTDAYDAHL